MPTRPTSARRTVALLALALALVTAGCGGAPSTPTDAAPGAGSPTEAPTSTGGPGTGTADGGTETTATPSPTPSPTPTPAEADLGNPEAFAQRHTDGLRSTGSFAARMVAVVETPNGTLNSTQLARVDFGSDRAYGENLFVVENETFKGTLGGRLYRASGTLHTQAIISTSDGEPLIFNDTEAAPAPLNLTNAVPGNETATFGGEVAWAADQSWLRTGRTTYRGTRVTEYSGSIDTNLAGLFEDDRYLSGLEYTGQGAELTMLVDDEGVVRRLEAEFRSELDGDVVTIRIRLTITDVGSTTVTPPEFAEDGS